MPTPAAPPVVPTRAETLDHLEGELGVLLRRIRWVLSERAATTHPDITVPGYLILRRLQRDGPRRSSVLVEEFGVDKGAISRQVQQLVDLHMVDRTADPDDGRAQLLSISAIGVERLDASREGRRALLESRLGDWSDDDLDSFVGGLTRYNAAFSDTTPAT